MDDERREDHEMREIIDRVATSAAEKTVPAVLERLGLDVSDPIEAQSDMAFLRQSRKRCERFYNDMYENLFSAGLKLVKIVLLVIVVLALSALGFNIEPLLDLVGFSIDTPQP